MDAALSRIKEVADKGALHSLKEVAAIEDVTESAPPRDRWHAAGADEQQNECKHVFHR